jgi:carbon monoxide dehydrogenase subunit G
MKMTGEEIIAAPRQLVWEALNDPEVLKKSISGCQDLTKKSDTELDARVTAKVGPVKATFLGSVTLSKLNPPSSYVITGEGKGGVAGFAKGGATVQLSDTGEDSTRLSYDVDAQVGGKLAQIGSRLIDSTAKKMAADFFNKFNKIVSEMAKKPESEEKKPAKKAAAKKPATKKAAAKKAVAKKPAAQKAPAKARAAATKASAKTASKAAKKPARKAKAPSVDVTPEPPRAAAPTEVVSSVTTPKDNTPTTNMPPQAQAMSRMWLWITIAAAVGLLGLMMFGGD